MSPQNLNSAFALAYCRRGSDTAYRCPDCGVVVCDLRCGTCDRELKLESIVNSHGTATSVSRCPKLCGEIPLPECCGKPMIPTTTASPSSPALCQEGSKRSRATVSPALPRQPKRIRYQCGRCKMNVKGIKCGKCGAGMIAGAVELGGKSVNVSKCPSGCGMIKSPLCCGKDMIVR
ncbi:hypothetical protein DFS34DRAFT_233469 [Phlyctochytrium arcticum]|nr:hypothetical protein DFS34DRAFT_233469 [Phlyctochytrium arcticum]